MKVIVDYMDIFGNVHGAVEGITLFGTIGITMLSTILCVKIFDWDSSLRNSVYETESIIAFVLFMTLM